MSNTSAWSKYIFGTCGGENNLEIAARVGVSAVTVGRWKTGVTNEPSPLDVVKYARAYGLNPLAAFIAIGYANADDLGVTVSVPAITLADFSLIELAREIASRMETDPAFSSTTAFPPATNVGGKGDYVAVTN